METNDNPNRSHEQIPIQQKALRVNLDHGRYGTLAEIGAGQETARWFFHVGGAAGTVAKSISAYDMKFSDSIYGKSQRYVSRERLQLMLDYEYKLLRERLADSRGVSTSFFVFANTVTARSYTRKQDGVAWLGMKFQQKPQTEASQIILHARLLDDDNLLQQEAVGILGVNLIYGASYLSEDLEVLIESLGDDLARDRFEVNLIHGSGPAFTDTDNRVGNLELIRKELTPAVMLSADGEVVDPATILYKKRLLIQRGDFRPITLAQEHMMTSALKHFHKREGVSEDQVAVLLELTTHKPFETSDFDQQDVIACLETLAALRRPVLVSNIPENYRLEEYLSRYSDREIDFVAPAHILARVLHERYYEQLDGGLLESLGRLFKHGVRLLIYPSRNLKTGGVLTAENLVVSPKVEHLYKHLLSNNLIQPLEDYREDLFEISPSDVLASIQSRGKDWESKVPAPVASVIKTRRLFGYSEP